MVTNYPIDHGNSGGQDPDKNKDDEGGADDDQLQPCFFVVLLIDVQFLYHSQDDATQRSLAGRRDRVNDYHWNCDFNKLWLQLAVFIGLALRWGCIILLCGLQEEDVERYRYAAEHEHQNLDNPHSSVESRQQLLGAGRHIWAKTRLQERLGHWLRRKLLACRPLRLGVDVCRVLHHVVCVGLLGLYLLEVEGIGSMLGFEWASVNSLVILLQLHVLHRDPDAGILHIAVIRFLLLPLRQFLQLQAILQVNVNISPAKKLGQEHQTKQIHGYLVNKIDIEGWMLHLLFWIPYHEWQVDHPEQKK